MNAVVSLCHFCELHGPAVIFCTQAFHSPEPSSNVDPTELDSRDDDDRFTRSGDFSSLGCNSKDFVESYSSSAPASPSCGKSKVQDFCEACKPFANGSAGFISHDKESLVSYISSQNPRQPCVYSIIRHACIRSLTCEECPGHVGPIFFGDDCSVGDDKGSHVLSFKFFLKDFHSRGFKRQYSILVVMRDKIFLLNSWPFLTRQIEHIITQLMKKAEDVFNGEHSQHPNNPQRKPPLPSPNVCPDRHNKKQTRSLIEITNDKTIFEQLHIAFTWLLKAGGNRLTERMLEGPPTEDSIIDMDRVEETEEGFVKLYSRANMQMDWSAVSASDEDENDASNSIAVFTHLRSLLKILGRTKFIDLAHHVIVGHQIIVRAQQKKLIRSVIDCLKTLLPKGCCRSAYITKDYKEWELCNFIGMLLQPLFPDDIVKPCVVMDISGVRHVDHVESLQIASEQTSLKLDAEVEELKRRYYLITPTNIENLPAKVPTLLEKMEAVLMNDGLENSVVDLCLTCLKEEWLNKAKALYKFTKTGGNRSKEEEEKLLQIVGAHEEDRMVLKFWMEGLQQNNRTSTRTGIQDVQILIQTTANANDLSTKSVSSNPSMPQFTVE